MVPAPFAFTAVERRAVPDRDECVLQPCAALVVRMHVAGCDGRHAQRLCELLQPGVPADVATFVRTLQLDVERAFERTRQSGGAVHVDDAEAVSRAAGEGDEPFGVLLEHVEARLGRQQVAFLPWHACPRVRVGEDPTEVRVATLRLAEQRDVCASDGHFGTGDRTDAEVLRRVRELE